MSMLPVEMRHLPVSDRLTLVGELWDSIADDQQQIDLTEAQRSELDRRLAARASRPDAASSWSDVKRRILGQ
jgi:putative addiction module component (TIGR02574 family)